MTEIKQEHPMNARQLAQLVSRNVFTKHGNPRSIQLSETDLAAALLAALKEGARIQSSLEESVRDAVSAEMPPQW